MSDDVATLLAADPDQMTYEQARDGLSAIVNQLEGGSASLEESLALWEKGEALAKRCNQWLDDADQRLAAAAVKGPDGEVATAGSPDADETVITDVPF